MNFNKGGRKTYDAQMLIVTPDMDIGWIIFANINVMRDIEDLGSRDMEDILGKEQPPEPGVWIWEGKQTWTTSYTPEGDYDCDTRYHDGTWRRPTEEELAQFTRGESPWPTRPARPVDPNHKPDARHCICCDCNGHEVSHASDVPESPTDVCKICRRTRAEIAAFEAEYA